MTDIPEPPAGEMIPGGHRGDPAIPFPNPNSGWRMNHSMLRIRDPVASLHFYIDLMGMRTIFTTNAGPYTIYFLGYPTTKEQESKLAHFVQSSLANMRNLSLLELLHVHGSENADQNLYTIGNTPPHLGFGHLGFSVPDVTAALDHLKSAGVEIIKPLGVATRESVPLSDWEAQQGIGLGDLNEQYQQGFKQIGFVKDPDGYWIELVPEVFK